MEIRSTAHAINQPLTKPAPKPEQENLTPLDIFSAKADVPEHKRITGKEVMSFALKSAVGAGIGAGVLALSGGSVLAAIGLSTAFSAGLGALKGVASAFLSSLNFGGHSGASSAIDRDPAVLAVVMGAVGALKGAAEGLVFGTLSGMGFGACAGATAGAVMPTLEKGVSKLIGKIMEHHHQHGIRD
ncbi:MAG: hypothetical protein RDV48_00445 [Candidatus Eremiobacteraeota bacterium]|nr:hypothetical protein [Candidatus Eremiobacteraeota bacterium]